MAAARHGPSDRSCVVRRSCRLSSGGGTSPGYRQDDFNTALVRDLVAVTFADFSLRCHCSKQHVHSGLYDGLTWPDTGFASFD